MKAKGKLLILVVFVIGSILFFNGFLSGSAQAQKAIEWKAITSWTPVEPHVKYIYIPFVEEVNKKAGGRLRISMFGPEAVSPFEQFKPLREGMFDISFS